jgi:hypothetical protein
MNRSQKTVFRRHIIVLALITFGCALHAQTETKTFTERFNVAPDAVLDIKTSHTDITFETWDQEVVEVESTVMLEGVSKEEAEDYFSSEPIQVLGNSKKVSIVTKSKASSFFGDKDIWLGVLDIDLPEIAPFVMEMSELAPFPEVVNMPPLPMTKAFAFDYAAYKKDGEKYMKKWQKNFERSFDKEHQKKLEAWAEKVEQRAEAMEERIEEREQHMAEYVERRKELMERREEAQARRMENIQADMEDREEARAIRLHENDKNAPNIFFLSPDGEGKSYKIKKSIKIKLPKSTQIKMDVRHGAIKLAQNTQNLNATLSHSTLWANAIDGSETNVRASYSPLTVQKWNNGQLVANYSKDIALQQVLRLQLQANSSEVTISELHNTAFIQNDFGPLHILAISNEFERLDVSLKNAELHCALPEVATDFYVKATVSEVKLPNGLKLESNQNGNTTIQNGYFLSKNSNKSISLNADYSEVVVQ